MKTALPQPEDLLSAGEAGRLLNMGSGGVGYWVRRGELVPLGRTRQGPIFRRGDVEAFAARREAARNEPRFGARRTQPELPLTAPKKRAAG